MQKSGRTLLVWVGLLLLFVVPLGVLAGSSSDDGAEGEPSALASLLTIVGPLLLAFLYSVRPARRRSTETAGHGDCRTLAEEP